MGGLGTGACSHSAFAPMVGTWGIFTVIVGLLVEFHVKLLRYL